MAIDGLPSSRGIYGGPVGGPGSNGGPNMSASSFAAAAAAAAAASNGSNSTGGPGAMMIPGVSVSVDSVQQLPESGGVTWGEMMRKRKEYTLFKKLVQLLQDNRLKSGDEEAAEKLRELNRSQNESFPVLKSILNAIFITTGVVLLIAVVVVIIYTSIVDNDDNLLNTSTDSSRSSGTDFAPHSKDSADDLSQRSNARLFNNTSQPFNALQGMQPSDGSSRQTDSKGVKICRTMAIEQEGENRVVMVPMCYQASSTGDDRSG